MFPNFLYSIYHVIAISLPLVRLAMDAGKQDEGAEVEENHPDHDDDDGDGGDHDHNSDVGDLDD